MTLYAAQGPEITDPLLKAFAARHPRLAVRVVRGGTGEMIGRIRAEKRRALGDVLWGGAPEVFAVNADLFAPLELPEAGSFELRDPAGRWHPFTSNVIHLVVNTARTRGHVPTGFQDLLDPGFRRLGPVGFANPSVSGTGYTVATALVAALGWDGLTQLLRNCWLTDSSDSMFKWIKDGETAAGFLFETTLRDYLAAGAPLRPVLAPEGLIVQNDGAGLIAGAPHPEAGRAFLRFLASAEAHEIVRQRVGRRSARRGVAPAAGLLDLTGRTRIETDSAWRKHQRTLILTRFEAAREAAGR